MIKAFVFDVGDCIEPSTKLEIENLVQIRKKWGLPNSFEKSYLEMDKHHELHMSHATGELKIMKMTLNNLRLNLDAKKLSNEMQSLYWTKLRKYYTKEKLGKEFISLIKYLRKHNYKVAILSDDSFQAKSLRLNMLENQGLKFDAYVVSAEVGVEKPNKKIFQETLKHLDVKPKNAVYFGNNLQRDSAAKKFGWDFVWVYGFIGDINTKRFKGKKMKFITLKNILNYLK